MGTSLVALDYANIAPVLSCQLVHVVSVHLGTAANLHSDTLQWYVSIAFIGHASPDGAFLTPISQLAIVCHISADMQIRAAWWPAGFVDAGKFESKTETETETELMERDERICK